jgi:hypothetical protein
MKDTIFTMRSTPYKFGVGATNEIGDDLEALGLKRVLLVTDNGVASTGLPARVMELVREHHIEVELFQDIDIEPTDTSVNVAIRIAPIPGRRRICGGWRRERHGHREADESLCHISRAIPDLCERADRRRAPGAGSAAPHGLSANDGGHLVGKYCSRHHRYDAAACEDRRVSSFLARKRWVFSIH